MCAQVPTAWRGLRCWRRRMCCSASPWASPKWKAYAATILRSSSRTSTGRSGSRTARSGCRASSSSRTRPSRGTAVHRRALRLRLRDPAARRTVHATVARRCGSDLVPGHCGSREEKGQWRRDQMTARGFRRIMKTGCVLLTAVLMTAVPGLPGATFGWGRGGGFGGGGGFHGFGRRRRLRRRRFPRLRRRRLSRLRWRGWQRLRRRSLRRHRHRGWVLRWWWPRQRECLQL